MRKRRPFRHVTQTRLSSASFPPRGTGEKSRRDESKPSDRCHSHFPRSHLSRAAFFHPLDIASRNRASALVPDLRIVPTRLVSIGVDPTTQPIPRSHTLNLRTLSTRTWLLFAALSITALVLSTSTAWGADHVHLGGRRVRPLERGHELEPGPHHAREHRHPGIRWRRKRHGDGAGDGVDRQAQRFGEHDRGAERPRRPR